ncbi:hypothetical protein [Shewanella maritima]|uniref:hypothetical protein n=1 Tax=Shewanella maritima TaxID=2520507 RepID=UPI0037353E6A
MDWLKEFSEHYLTNTFMLLSFGFTSVVLISVPFFTEFSWNIVIILVNLGFWLYLSASIPSNLLGSGNNNCNIKCLCCFTLPPYLLFDFYLSKLAVGNTISAGVY